MSILSTRTAAFACAAIVLALAAAGLASLSRPVQANSPASAQAPAAPVDAALVVSRNIIDWRDYSGRIEAVERVEIHPLVSGTLTAVHFKDGAMVRKGDVLFTIDPRPYEAAVARGLAQAEAAKARAGHAESDRARAERLLADNAIAKRDYDAKQNDAHVAQAELLAAQAALKAARIDLEHTRIVAPVAGRISRARVTAGNVVSAGTGGEPLTTLVSVNKMYAAFDVDELTYLKLAQASRAGGAPMPVQLGLADETGYARQGAVSFVDNRLDTASGTIRVRAIFDNADGTLIPGLYARLRLGTGRPREAVLVEERAVGTDQEKRYVLVLDADNRAVYREVRLGRGSGGLRVVEAGLAPGERIIVNGLQRVRPGEIVAPRDVSMSVPAADRAGVV